MKRLATVLVLVMAAVCLLLGGCNTVYVRGDRQHQLNVVSYIRGHERDSAAVWSRLQDR